MGAHPGYTIRPYRPADRAAVYDICVRTADAGGDARGRYLSDDLLPDLYAGPYLRLEPGLAFVLAGPDRAVGYVLGTADTAGFVDAFRQRWTPLVADRYPRPPDPPGTPDEVLVEALYHPEWMLRTELAGYPAHLHIDLLPGYQGAGYGRRLVGTFLAAAARAGAGAVHLGVAQANVRARGFYDRLGFHEIAVPGAAGVTYLGRTTAT